MVEEPAHPVVGPGLPAHRCPELVELAPRVFAYLQLDGQWGLSNCGAVVGSDDLLVIDTCYTRARTLAFKRALEEVASTPVNLVANTHHHADHTYGNEVFEGATVLAHPRVREHVRHLGKRSMIFREQESWFPALELRPPVVAVQSATIHVDDVAVDVRAPGHRAHTDNDLVYVVRDHGIVFAGDLAFAGVTPLAVAGSVSGSIRACRWLQTLGVSTIVPGHGPVSGPEVLDDMIEYFELIERSARAATASGQSPLEAALATDLGRFSTWPDSERLVANVWVAMREQGGLGAHTGFDVVSGMESFAGAPLHNLALTGCGCHVELSETRQ